MHLTQVVSRGALLKGSRTALHCGDESRTWREFADRVARLAGVLADLGVKADTGVAILADSGFPYFEYHFAVPWAGGVMVPLNTRLADAELGYILNDAQAEVLICGAEYASRLPALRKLAPGIREVLTIDVPADGGHHDYETLLRARAPLADCRRGGSDLLAIIYTGGTTGHPKGVALAHSNLVANTLAQIPNMEFHEDMVYLHSTPVFHTAGSARIYSTMTALGTGIIQPRFDVDGVLEAVEKHRVTHLLLVPTMINRLLNSPRFADTDFSSVTNISYGASIMPESLVRKALQLLPKVRFTQSYGMTELSPSAAYLQPKYHVLEGPLAGRIKSIGQPIHTAEIRIADEQDNEVPRGEVGEIQVRGPMVMQGYWKQPEATAETIRDGWIHTGDIAWRDAEGRLYLVDRKKDMIISGGFNIYPRDIEDVLTAHPAVARAAVIGVPDPKWGEAVKALVVTKPGETPDADALAAWIKERKGSTHVPKSFEFVERMPLTPLGKVDKAVLRAPYWAGRDRQVN